MSEHIESELGVPICPLIPMGAVTGSPDEESVRERLEACKSVGIDQYMIYARSGLELEYMGDEWLQVCKWFCKHARRLGMSIWLYDEYNWPSGSCKGQVPAESPDFESRQYAIYRRDDGLFEWVLIHSPGWADNYSFKAMERFVELTHNRYEQALGPYLGSTIRAIFTDEPTHPVPAEIPGNPVLTIRYFDEIEEEYKTATGRDFRSDVETYVVDNSQNEVWSVYSDLLGTRFRKAYFDPIRAWCDRTGVFSTGHIIYEHNTSDSTKFNGNPLHVLKGLSLPGVDEIMTRTTPENIEWLTFAIAQHAVDRRGNGGVVELFAVGPCDMSHAVQRQMIWLCAMHKLDHYVLAVSPLDMRGNLEKQSYFNPQSPAQPWFPAFRLLGNEARCAACHADKSFRYDVAIRYPQAEAAKLSVLGKEHVLLIDTLRCLSRHQITVDLCEENEDCDKLFILIFSGKILIEERSGRVFNTPEDAMTFILAEHPPIVWVEGSDGRRAEDLLLRHCQDGSVVVLDISAEPRNGLCLMGRSVEPICFNLPARGVFVLNGEDNECQQSNRQVVQENGDDSSRSVFMTQEESFSLHLGSANTLRLAFDKSGTARFTLRQPIENVRLVARCLPNTYSLTLDANPVQTEYPCDSLVQGFNELCRQTAPFRLEVGEHEVTIESGDKEDSIYYLPVAWLTGGFIIEGGVVTDLPKTVAPCALWQQGLANFAGEATFTAEVEVPVYQGGVHLRINTGGLYALVTLGGVSLGERAWEPFEWMVPDELQGRKAVMKITIYTSIAPLFGNYSAPGAVWSDKMESLPNPKPAAGILSSPEWVFC